VVLRNKIQIAGTAFGRPPQLAQTTCGFFVNCEKWYIGETNPQLNGGLQSVSLFATSQNIRRHCPTGQPSRNRKVAAFFMRGQ
jgi:hypothetical protein